MDTPIPQSAMLPQSANGQTQYPVTPYTPPQAGINPSTGTSMTSSPVTSAPPPPVTFDASTLNQPTPLNLPSSASTQYNPSGATTANLGTNIMTPSQAVAPETQQTPAEATNQSLMQKVASLQGIDKTQDQLTQDAENQAGLPALKATADSLNSQLTGLNDQATALQNAASYTIPNQEQQNATGRGITAAGLAPIQSADLRNNQIQQGAIATQALTVKSLLLAAQSRYSDAQTAADNAAKYAFDAQTQQINQINALIDANKAQMTKEEQAQADTVKANLADRQTQIQQGIDNAKSGQALIAAAMANNPNDPQAQYAVQQASKLDMTDPQYLQKVTALVGNYQTDQVKAQLANELTQSTINKNNADINKGTAPTSSEVVTGINSLLGTKNAQGVPYTDAQGYFTKAGFQSLVQMAGENGMNRADFIKQYGSYLNPSGYKNYGLTAGEIKSI